jgi:para-aminobenzoate synthetase component 1
MAFSDYEVAFADIRKQIKAGNSFLTNLTFPTPIDINLTFNQIFELSQAKYKVLIENEFLCFSPETFVTIQQGIISTFPMKGTINASVPMADQLIMSNTKEIAEHNTVVDLLRNDLSLVAKDVTLKRFRYIDRITTHLGELLQVSSEISGRLPDNYHQHLGDILFAMLPAGSVTGAPKNRTVAIIKNAEKTDRGYYTGICGIFDGKNLDSAVMIRFIEIHKGKMRFRSGGGITFLSKAREEYNELIDKVYVPIA